MKCDDHGQPVNLGFNWHNNLRKKLSTLCGICMGMLADGQLSDQEVLYLDTWLKDNADFAMDWPGNILHERLRCVLDDGVITPRGREHLFQTLENLIGGTLEETGAAGGMATRLPIEQVDSLEFQDRCFCFTGKFIYGSRSKCMAEVESRGGVAIDRVTLDLDYLVIGTLASRDWVHTSHGRKIEKALEYKKKGNRMTILGEEDWVVFLSE